MQEPGNVHAAAVVTTSPDLGGRLQTGYCLIGMSDADQAATCLYTATTIIKGLTQSSAHSAQGRPTTAHMMPLYVITSHMTAHVCRPCCHLLLPNHTCSSWVVPWKQQRRRWMQQWPGKQVRVLCGSLAAHTGSVTVTHKCLKTTAGPYLSCSWNHCYCMHASGRWPCQQCRKRLRWSFMAQCCPVCSLLCTVHAHMTPGKSLCLSSMQQLFPAIYDTHF